MSSPQDTRGVEEMEPCPFCASATGARMFPPTCRPETPYNPADRLFPIVRCGNCFTEVCGANEDYTGKTAIAAWNTRPEAVTDELIEALSIANEALQFTYAMHKRGRETVPDEEEGLAAQVFCHHINHADGRIIDAISIIDAALSKVSPLIVGGE